MKLSRLASNLLCYYSRIPQTRSRYTQEIRPLGIGPLEEYGDKLGTMLTNVSKELTRGLYPKWWIEAEESLEREERGRLAREGKLPNRFFIDPP